jgi:hypothetical protein
VAVVEKDLFGKPVAESMRPWQSAPPILRSRRDGTLLKRYNDGDRRSVWHELQANAAVSGEFREEAMEIAVVTMGRIARNADKLAERLEVVGWQPLFGNMRMLPAIADEENMSQFEQLAGCALPVSLMAFWNIVGGIDFIWDYDAEEEMPVLWSDVSLLDADPLCISAARELRYCVDSWKDQIDEEDESESELRQYLIELAPDSHHKANYSGGNSYGINLPNWKVDPIFVNEPNQLPFTDYLRLSFEWAGFPGLKAYANQKSVRDFVVRFAEGMEPF